MVRTRAYRSRWLWVPAVAVVADRARYASRYAAPIRSRTHDPLASAASWDSAARRQSTADRRTGEPRSRTLRRQGRTDRVAARDRSSACRRDQASYGATWRIDRLKRRSRCDVVTPSRGQVLVTRVGDIAPICAARSACSVESARHEVKLTAVLGEDATFGGYHQYPMRTPAALVPWLGDPLAQCNRRRRRRCRGTRRRPRLRDHGQGRHRRRRRVRRGARSEIDVAFADRARSSTS